MSVTLKTFGIYFIDVKFGKEEIWENKMEVNK